MTCRTLRILATLPLCVAILAATVAAQDRHVARVGGIVRDEGSAIPLPGVPVEVVGTSQIVYTDVDGRYALHSFPCEDVDDEFMVAGVARQEPDDTVFDAVMTAYLAQRTTSSGDELLFELGMDRVLHAEYGPRPSWPPRYERWRAG